MLSKYGPWALILGGSEGIGASFARQLAAEKFNLVLVARKPQPLTALGDALKAEFGIDVRAIGVDLTNSLTLDQLLFLTSDIEIGLLIYNAGAFHDVGDFLDRPIDQARAMIDLNISAPTLLSHHFAAGMRDRGRGGIMFIGSLACMAGNAKVAVYAAAKSYLKILAEGLWLELRPHGVDVLGLILGLTRTPAYERDGFDTDHPQFPMADPDDAAREGLLYLAEGPIRIPDAYADFVTYLGALPRGEAVAMLSDGTQAVTLKASDSK